MLDQTALMEATPVVLADGRRARNPDLDPSRRVLARFGASTVLALLVVLMTSVVFSSRAAERAGVADASRVTALVAHGVVEPNLPESLLSGDPAAVAAMDRFHRSRLAGISDLVRVKVWSADGRILYSDERRLIGSRRQLSKRELAALRLGTSYAELSDLGRRDHRFDRALGAQLLEVHSGMRTDGGTPMLLEAYFSFDVVDDRRTVLLWSFATITLIGLFVFAAFQLSLGYTTVRWLRRERERLVMAAQRGSEDERRRLATDLHDGIVQDLVGASYVVSGASAELARRGDHLVSQDNLSSAADSIRSSIQGLRSMIVDLYPASLGVAGLAAAISDLVAPLRAVDTRVDVSLPDDLRMPEQLQGVMYRVTQEAVRNIVLHGRATAVSIHLEIREGHSVLSIADNGVGFTVGAPVVPGHIGLRAMADVAHEAGALLQLTSSPGCGTTIRLELSS